MPILALPADAMTIGRAPDCECLVVEASVSRRHAHLRREGERWLLRDLGSSNGTRVNGMRVTEEVEVRPGDQLNLGGVRFRAACRAR
jgi:pSer/pThr/pTyr-binding forkhead associated (FHA) protein